MKINSVKDLKTLAEIARKRMEQESATVRVGMSSCGLAAGAAPVFESFQKAARDRARPIRVVASGCLGFCGAEPLVDIFIPEKGRAVLGPVDQAAVGEILECVEKGQFPARNLLGYAGETADSDDIEVARMPSLLRHPFYRAQVRRVTRNLGLIDPESLEEYLAAGGYVGMAKALTGMSSEQIIEEISRSGLRGRGGAGFPTGLKWSNTRKASGSEKFVIMNGDEGDPGAYMDRSLMEGDPHAILEGMIIGAYAIGAGKGILYVRAEYPLAQKRLARAIEDARSAGLLGENILGTGFDFDLFIVSGVGAFISGEETALINAVEGKIAEPEARPPYPSEKGLYGKPTSINNVETWANVPLIIDRGADWFAQMGNEKSRGTKLFCLVGEVERTGLVEVPLGTPLSTIVNEIGGGGRDGLWVKAIQTGGPSGGCIPAEVFSLPLDYENLQRMGTIMGSGGLVVMSERTCMVDVAKYFLNFTQHESCGKCTPCREGTEHLAGLLDAVSRGDGTQEDLADLEKFSRSIAATSLCGLGQSAPNPVLTALKYFREEFDAHVFERRCPAGVCSDLLVFSIDPENCTGCQVCVDICPAGAISGGKKQPHLLDGELCIKCGACQDACKFDAVKVQ